MIPKIGELGSFVSKYVNCSHFQADSRMCTRIELLMGVSCKSHTTNLVTTHSTYYFYPELFQNGFEFDFASSNSFAVLLLCEADLFCMVS